MRVGALEHGAGDAPVGGLREVHPVPGHVLRRVGARRRPRRAAERVVVEVVRAAAAAAARGQRPAPETCTRRIGETMPRKNSINQRTPFLSLSLIVTEVTNVRACVPYLAGDTTTSVMAR